MTACAKHFLMFLAVLALGAAQVFGVGRGYFCDCTGNPETVDRALCESAVCHPGQGHHRHHHDDDGHDHNDGDDNDHSDKDAPHEHQKITESLKSGSFVPLTVDLPAAVEMSFPQAIAPGVQLACDMAQLRAELKPPDDTGENPDTCVLVARTIVMLV